ncbi:MAG: hypothetical protein EZS28_001698 [Streblomastix strix]|uniref:Uncharacterized protein n=1 Tax=Streblomastix strix TaxID=222440 RepID=A0A5J4X6V6_9EUKA|nr:MAG: hypothetical protein EZS28_001698 [Streblomastix strix]
MSGEEVIPTPNLESVDTKPVEEVIPTPNLESVDTKPVEEQQSTEAENPEIEKLKKLYVSERDEKEIKQDRIANSVYEKGLVVSEFINFYSKKSFSFLNENIDKISDQSVPEPQPDLESENQKPDKSQTTVLSKSFGDKVMQFGKYYTNGVDFIANILSQLLYNNYSSVMENEDVMMIIRVFLAFTIAVIMILHSAFNFLIDFQELIIIGIGKFIAKFLGKSVEKTAQLVIRIIFILIEVLITIISTELISLLILFLVIFTLGVLRHIAKPQEQKDE